MMLRASSETFGYQVDLRAVVDTTIPSGIPGGSVLLDFTDAALFRNGLDAARQKLIRGLGEEALVGSAGVIGNFSMMNRIADATGMPTGKGTLAASEEIRQLLELDRFMH